MGARLSRLKTVGPKSMRTRSARQRGGARSAPKTRRTTGRGGLHDLLAIFHGLSGFQTNTLGLQEFKTTYGEVSTSGIQALSEKFRALAPLAKFPSKKFVDLGCGIGRVVVGMAILNPDLQSVGYEIVPERVRSGTAAISRIPSRQIAARSHVSIGNILDKAQTPLGDCAWVFISNLCFDDATQRALADRLGAELPPGATVICSKEFPEGHGKGLTRVESGFVIPMTWSQNSQCHAYRRV